MTHGALDEETRYGPQWQQIAELAQRIVDVSQEQAQAMVALARAEPILALTFGHGAAWPACVEAAEAAGAEEQQEAACNSVFETAGYEFVDSIERFGDVIVHTTAALQARHLIGAGDWTAEAYDVLTGAWRRVIGALHHDDAPLR